MTTKPQDKFCKYIDYINNTRQQPLPVRMFDEDWEPVGPMLRTQMAAADIIQVRADGIYLRPDLIRAESPRHE